MSNFNINELISVVEKLLEAVKSMNVDDDLQMQRWQSLDSIPEVGTQTEDEDNFNSSPTSINYSKMKVSELRKLCCEKWLDTIGTRKQLIERLRNKTI